jgi:hypothetical protein
MCETSLRRIFLPLFQQLKEFRGHLAIWNYQFTAEVWTLGGLVTYYVLFFLHLGSRKVHVAGVTPHPNEAWMMQVARGCVSGIVRSPG